jgi:outer membrane receptor protein involved in Fe transport
MINTTQGAFGRPHAFKSLLLASAVSAIIAAPAQAQSQSRSQFTLEEVIVTAQKRAESLQDVPISVLALSGDRMRDAGIQRVEDLSKYVPNFQMTETTTGNQIFIRGVGSGLNRGFEQSVGMFIDGVYAGRSQQFRNPFMDIAMVEVLRGPQGTLFGKNTVAGAINIRTQEPTDEFEAEVRATYEMEYGDPELEGFFSGPITDNLSGRIAARYREAEGFIDNRFLDEDEPQRDEQAIRGSLMWTPTDDLELLLKAETGSFDAEGQSSQVTNANGVFDFSSLGITQFLPDLLDPSEDGKLDFNKAADSHSREATDTDTDNVVLTVNWDVSDFTVTSITGYSSYSFDQLADGDVTNLRFIQQDTAQDFDQYSQEIRLASPLGEQFEYIVGAYYQYQELENTGSIDFDPTAIGVTILPPTAVGSYSDFDQEAETFALFGQATYHFNDAWHLTVGLRWNNEDKEATQDYFVTDLFGKTPTSNPVNKVIAETVQGSVDHYYDEDRSRSNTSPSVTLTWDYDDDTMLYARYAKGFKSGGFNEAEVTGDLDRFLFDDEEADSLEIGSKLTLLDGAATLNTALFYTEYTDRQVSAFEDVSFVVGNAAESTSQGLEMDGRWRVTEHLSLSASLAYLDSEFDDFKNASCQAEDAAVDPGCTQDLSGETTQYAPEWSGSLGIRYARPITDSLEFIGQADANYTDEYYHAQDLDPEEVTDSYTEYNARLAVAQMDGRWEVALIGKNLTDETTNIYGNDIPSFTGAHFSFVAPPRTVAIQGILRF